MTIRLLLLALGVLALARPVTAQSPATGYLFKYYNVGAASPIQSQTVPLTSVTCNQPPIVSTSTVNPRGWQWDDEANPTKVCTYLVAPGDPLLALPLGPFEGTVSTVNAMGPSDESQPRSPFQRDAVRKAPTGLRVVR